MICTGPSTSGGFALFQEKASTTQPASQTVTLGSSVTFTVVPAFFPFPTSIAAKSAAPTTFTPGEPAATIERCWQMTG